MQVSPLKEPAIEREVRMILSQCCFKAKLPLTKTCTTVADGDWALRVSVGPCSRPPVGLSDDRRHHPPVSPPPPARAASDSRAAALLSFIAARARDRNRSVVCRATDALEPLRPVCAAQRAARAGGSRPSLHRMSFSLYWDPPPSRRAGGSPPSPPARSPTCCPPTPASASGTRPPPPAFRPPPPACTGRRAARIAGGAGPAAPGSRRRAHVESAAASSPRF